MAPLYLDTHIATWLFVDARDEFSRGALSLIDDSELLVSPMVELELGYLHEISRLAVLPSEILVALDAQYGVKICDAPFAQVVNAALDHPWTRDPFDRLIVGQAAATNRQLLTADQSILDNFALAAW